ncbi:LCP family protein [Alloscardovia omnicolens]|uniref:LCP family glycopolymer transferase n=1 Tax=Alloscardovia omnicolens TaxID=419015 RepID=UPI003A758928
MARIPQNNEHPDNDFRQSAPPSFQPMHSRTPSRNVAENSQDSQNPQQTPPTFSPQRNRRTAHGSSSRTTPSTVRSVQSPQRDSRSPYHKLGVPPQQPHSKPSSAPFKKVRLSRIIAAILATLLGMSVIFAVWAWLWVDGQLNRSIDLSPAPDNATAQSWLILGSDARDGQIASADANSVTGFRTDTILVLTKPRSGPASLVSIPRDSYVEVNGMGMKINAVAQSEGYDALLQSVEDITGTKIDHVAQIGFDGIAHIVDALGGIELCYDQTVNDEYSALNWTAGCHTVDGVTALAFSRMRYSDPEGDIGRAKRQRQVIGAVMKKAASTSTLTNPSKALKVASTTFKALSVDNKSDTGTMLSMAFAFKNATGAHGVTGSVYYDDVDYRPGDVGSAIHLVAEKNRELFSGLNSGSISEGTTVGGYVTE